MEFFTLVISLGGFSQIKPCTYKVWRKFLQSVNTKTSTQATTSTGTSVKSHTSVQAPEVHLCE